MRESCLIFLLFHYLTRLASVWQERAAELWMPFINFLFWEKFSPISERWSRLAWTPSAHRHIPEADLYCHKFLTYSWASVSRAFWLTLLLPFTAGKIRSLVILSHSKPGRSFCASLSQCGIRDWQHSSAWPEGSHYKKISDEVSPWIWESVLCITCLSWVLVLSLLFTVLIIPGFVGGIAIVIIIFYFISITKLLLCQPMDLTFPYSPPHPPAERGVRECYTVKPQHR